MVERAEHSIHVTSVKERTNLNFVIRPPRRTPRLFVEPATGRARGKLAVGRPVGAANLPLTG